MASVDTGGGEERKGKPKKINLRVDFTPMVDMNMLLITFFMFCTTLSKPQVMDIAMPTDQKLDKQDEVKVRDDLSITLILGKDNKVYYYNGLPNYQHYDSLKETTYAPDGLRAVLLKKNSGIVERMRELREEKFKNKRMTDTQFKKKADEIKSDKEGAIVVIKPTDQSTYRNLVDVLDEMQICSIDRYAIVDMGPVEDFLLKNYDSKGDYGKNNMAPDDSSAK